MDIPLPPTPLPLTRSELINRINAALADNNVQGISAEDVRSRMIEVVASATMLNEGSVPGDIGYLLTSGGTMTGPLLLAGDPAAPLEAATKAYADLKAPLDTPTFTGTPSAPTADPGDSTSQLATTQFVAELVDQYLILTGGTLSGPLVLAADPAAPLEAATKAYVDANAGGDTSGFLPLSGGTLTGPLALAGLPVFPANAASKQYVDAADVLKAPLASPTFTGVPAALTAAPGTNTTQLATTEFVTLAGVAKAGLAGATFTGDVVTTGGKLAVDRVGDGVPANLTLAADAGQAAQLSLYTDTRLRWTLGRNATGEAGLNAGSDLALAAWADDGTSPLGAAFIVTRSDRHADFPVSPTVPNVLAGDASGKVANTAFVATAVAGATAGGVPAGGTVNQVLAKLSATNYDMAWTNPAGVGTFLALSGGTLTGPLTLSANPTTGAQAANKAYVDAADALKAPLASPHFTGIPTADTAGAATSTTQIATTQFVRMADALKADLASPHFTGAPTAPTAGAATSTDLLATTQFVHDVIVDTLNSPHLTGVPTAPTPTTRIATTQIATTDFVNDFYLPFSGGTLTGALTLAGAPSATNHATSKSYVDTGLAAKAPLDTPHFTGTPTAPTPGAATSTDRIATTKFVREADALKADLVSPTFTGTPKGPTADVGTDTIQLATTAFVRNEIAARAGLVFPEDFSTTDDTDAIQDMFDYLAANGGRGMLTRWYNVDASIIVDGVKPFVVEGVGRYISGIKRNAGYSGTVLDVTCDKVILRSFGVDGNKRVQGALTHGVELRDTDNSRLEDLWVYDFTSTGIILTGDTAYDYNNHVDSCHVDGGSGVAGGSGPYAATQGGANGISLVTNSHSSVENCYVENIHSQTPCIALQFKGSAHSRIANCSVRNSFVSMGLHNDNAGLLPVNCQFVNINVAQPNKNYYDSSIGSGSTDSYPPVGLSVHEGFNINADAISIDGNGLANFTAIQVENLSQIGDIGATSIKASVSHIDGAGSYAFKLGCKAALLELQNIYDVGAVIGLFDAGAQLNQVRLGRLYDTNARRILAPYRKVTDNSGFTSNIVQVIGGVPRKTWTLEDDEAFYVDCDDGSTWGVAEVATNNSDEYFRGYVRVGSSPTIQVMAAGSQVVTSTGVLTTGTADGVDGKLNIYAATNSRLYIKNRMGSQRAVSVTYDLGY